MANLDTYEIDFEDLLDSVEEQALDTKNKDFEDIVDLDINLNREIQIGDIGTNTGYQVDNMIRFWNRYDEKKNIPVEDREPIKLIIDSYGGSLTDTFTIIDSVKNSKTPVEAIVIGCCYSGGFFTAISCPKRKAYKHASFLFHEGSTGTSGTSSQFENYTAFYKKQLNQLKELVLENTLITEEEYETIHREDLWYDAQEALKKGIIDEIF